jgi:sodium transport system permease protein
LLNLSSLGITGKFVIDQLSQVPGLAGDVVLSMPPAASMFWLAAALIPISALFSALCLACAALARSTKEGQYYLMPLMLVTMPLMMLPMSPGVELNLGNSLVPLTGLVLLLRSVIEGQYHEVLRFIAPVAAVTLACCLLAIRWAEEQFNRESVLFRESERLELGRWLVHLVRDRGDTPSLAQAALCVALIVVVQFFVSFALIARGAGEFDFNSLVRAVSVTQLACIFTPAMLMAIILTRKPPRTLLLERTPEWRHLCSAVGLGLLLHPLAVRFAEQLTRLYPISEETVAFGRDIEFAIGDAAYWWMPVLLIAVLPAVCEEFAFRGFVLSGFRHLGHKWWAIGLSAVAFGMVHMFLQQKISATLMGFVLGYVAVQTSSIWPCILLHAVHNSLQLTIPKLAEYAEQNPQSAVAGLVGGSEPLLYQPAALIVCGVGAAAILWGLHGVSYRRTAEEQLEEARQRQDSPMVGA